MSYGHGLHPGSHYVAGHELHPVSTSLQILTLPLVMTSGLFKLLWEVSILPRAGMAGAHQHTQLLVSFIPCFPSDFLLLEPILSGVLTS